MHDFGVVLSAHRAHIYASAVLAAAAAATSTTKRIVWIGDGIFSAPDRLISLSHVQLLDELSWVAPGDLTRFFFVQLRRSTTHGADLI